MSIDLLGKRVSLRVDKGHPARTVGRIHRIYNRTTPMAYIMKIAEDTVICEREDFAVEGIDPDYGNPPRRIAIDVPSNISEYELLDLMYAGARSIDGVKEPGEALCTAAAFLRNYCLNFDFSVFDVANGEEAVEESEA